MFNPYDNEFLNVYSEESDEELGIDYLESSMSESDEVNNIRSVESPINHSPTTPKDTVRDASPRVCNHYSKLGVKSIIFNMSDGGTYELVIRKRG
jgi:hypothetical protein